MITSKNHTKLSQVNKNKTIPQMSLKDMVKNYTVALTEASNESLYQEYKDMFDTYIDLQRETYELMFRKGWYVLEQAEGEKTGSKYNTLNQEFIDLNG